MVRTFQIALDPRLTAYDSVLYARSTCEAASTQLLCQDLVAVSGEKLKLNNTGAPLYVFVDTGAAPATNYDYALVVTPLN